MNNTVQTIDINLSTHDLHKFHGEQVCITGTLVVQGNDCYLASQAQPNERLIDITYPPLKQRLLDVASVRLGGPYLFVDPVQVTGTLNVSDSTQLINLVELTLTQDTQVHRIDFSSSI